MAKSNGKLTVAKEGNMLVVRIPLTEPTESASGKTLVVASTHGNVETDVEIDGRAVHLGLNAYIYRDKKN